MIAIPDFASAAMENWGAIIYRESALLVDEAASSAATRQWVAIVVAHEIAHMWFGNLVTMHWWTHLWLNEGFASYMEYKCVDSLFPEWRMWEQYVSGRMSAALRLDALENTHPVEVEVGHPGEISEIFDEVSYAKGSAVIRMLAEYLGEKTFREGLRRYLKKHAYKNTRTEDLWQALQAVSKKPVRQIMATWTKQPGYPLLRLTEQPQNLRLDQARFYSSRLSRQAAKNSQLWQVPVTYGSSKVLLTSRSQNLAKPKAPLKFNSGETSLLRVSYPVAYLQSLGRLVSAKKLPAIDRLGLIRDAFALSESGQLPAIKVLELALAYKNEEELIVWEELADGLMRLRSLLYGTAAYESYLAFCRSLFSGIGKKLGWSAGKNETHHRHMLRSLVLTQLGANGDQKVLSQAKSKLNFSRPLPANLKGVVYGLAARMGGKKVHTTLLAKYKAAASHEEQDRLGRSLAQFSDTHLLKLTLDFALSRQVRAQDAPFIIAAVFQNPAGRDLAWKFISQNWKELVKRYGDGLGLLSRLLKAAGVFTSRKKAVELEKFFKQHKILGAQRTVRQVLEKVRSNADWLEREEKNIYHWLQNRV
ncbi:MAG: M1 family metallopeptidase [Patescibacteria group bacterium]|nr:M1 family metallopeptidase [Patescibacteria group bacterium]